jgi:succinate-acetate transporter protein
MATVEPRTAVPAGGATTTGPLHHSGIGTRDYHHTVGTNGAGEYYDPGHAYGPGAGAYGHGVNNYRRIANPHPLGILAFGSTLFIYSLYAVHARGVHTTNAIVGMALFVGGLAQLLAGMWAFPRGSTLGATIYTLYGAFWISLATILIPNSGIIAAYTNSGELFNALGIYFMIWMAITIILLVASIRRHITFLVFFFFLTLFFLLSGAGYFRNNDKLFKAGGALGIVASVITLYLGLAKLLESDHRWTQRLPLGYMGSRDGTGVATSRTDRELKK